MAFIYKITNDINQKVYIGMTERTIEERFKEHCREYKQRRCEKRPLYSAMKKYGPEHFHVELVEETNSPEEREQYWIKYYNSYKEGYNATIGGDGKSHIDNNEIEKMLEACNRLGTVVAVRQETGHDVGCISRFLKQAGIQVATAQEINKERYSKQVAQCDKKTHKRLKTFNSLADAARYLQEKQISTSKDTYGIASHIGHVCKKQRSSAYGFYWEFI